MSNRLVKGKIGFGVFLLNIIIVISERGTRSSSFLADAYKVYFMYYTLTIWYEKEVNIHLKEGKKSDLFILLISVSTTFLTNVFDTVHKK